MTLGLGQVGQVGPITTLDVTPPGTKCQRTMAAKDDVAVVSQVCEANLTDQAIAVTNAILATVTP
jgi:hypothetical protein